MDKLPAHLVFSDGSSLGNPGSGGWGAVVVYAHGEVAELGGGERRTTNNRMELLGLIMALDELRDEEGDITIHTDSTYVMQGATEWYRGWIAKNWRTSTGDPVLNTDLWKKLLAAISERGKLGRVYWKRVPGHVGIAGNERADAIATGFAAGNSPELFVGPLSDYAIDILNIDIDPAKHEARIRAKKSGTGSGKAYSYVSEVGGKVMTHKTWTECEVCVKGKKAKFKKVFSAEEERALVREWAKK